MYRSSHSGAGIHQPDTLATAILNSLYPSLLFDGMLLELAIGDAYGAGFEYADSELVERFNDLSSYRQHPRHQIKPGCYTDDTQMSLAIAETLVAGEPWTPDVLAHRFVTAFKRDQREGYAGRFYQFLLQVQDGQQFLEGINWTSD